MTEEQARAWIRSKFGVSRETTLAHLVEETLAENNRQNLISRASAASIWARHIVDSAQLLNHDTSDEDSVWIDIGSGAGFPGLVIAALAERPVVLVEPRTRRVAFLRSVAQRLGLHHCEVHHTKAQNLMPLKRGVGVISARAVADMTTLFEIGFPTSHKNTIWLLPKGERAKSELEIARRAWHGLFHVEQSITDDRSYIVVAREVRPR